MAKEAAIKHHRLPLTHLVWRGLGAWNFYFILKFALLWYGYLNFHPFDNLLFLAFLLFPLRSDFLHKLRNWIAIPIGIASLYHDTWLPNIYSILSQGSDVLGFSGAYILELLNRFINWQMIGVGFILLVCYLYVSQWIRISVFTISFVLWLNIISLAGPSFSLLPNATQTTATIDKSEVAVNKAQGLDAFNSLPPTNANLNAYLQAFYEEQKNLHTDFPQALPQDSVPFSIIMIQICSLAWADIDAVGLRNAPLWKDVDLLFTDFDSAASYSGPAMIRLLRASCGQPNHDGLYKAAPGECYLMNDMAKLGFEPRLMLDHTGTFGNFLKQIRADGDLQAPLMSQAGISQSLVEFSGQPIYNDGQLLTNWLQQTKAMGDKRSITYFNLITLHDGNRSVKENQAVPFGPLVSNLFTQIDTFFQEVEKSGLKVMVIVIPEHGRNYTGDKLQMPGLRDIPSPTITNIPVGIKFIGTKAPSPTQPLVIDKPSSYLAVSDLIARVADGKIFEEPQIDWQSLIANLPQTPPVAANEGVTVMDYQGKPYILLKGDTNWVPYP